MKKDLKLISFCVNSPIGYLEIVVQQNKLYSIAKTKRPSAQKHKLNAFAISIKKQLQDYFSGRRQAFNIPLADRGSDFQKKVWNILMSIPYGQTRTYGEVASILSNGQQVAGDALLSKHNLQGSDNNVNEVAAKATPSGGAAKATPSGGAAKATPSGGAAKATPSGGAAKATPSGGAAQSLPLGGARSVGQACAKNPFLIVVPCHRVLSRQGLGGFAYGLTAKKQLLKLEKT